jgi:hypothetical protein
MVFEPSFTTSADACATTATVVAVASVADAAAAVVAR